MSDTLMALCDPDMSDTLMALCDPDMSDTLMALCDPEEMAGTPVIPRLQC